MPERFAADLAALFRDPAGVTELRSAFHSDDDSTLSSAVFLQRCAARKPRATLDARSAASPGNLIAAARWVGMTAMAEPWLGAVRTWHETQGASRDPAITPAAEQELYWRLAGGWPLTTAELLEHLAAWPIGDVDSGRLAALTEDEAFRYTFDGAAARVREIGERVALGQLVLRMTVPGQPLLYPEDIDGVARLWPEHAGTPTADPQRGALLDALQGLRDDRPELFELPLTAVDIPPGAAADDRVCCFLRGDQLLVAVAVGDRSTGACGWVLPPEAGGRWRDHLTGRTFELPDRASLAGILGPDGRAVLTRAG